MLLQKKMNKISIFFRIKFTIIILSLLSFSIIQGQNCLCDWEYDYNGFRIPQTDCIKQCQLLIDKISLYHKIYDLSNKCHILRTQTLIRDVDQLDNDKYINARNNLMDYLGKPFKMNFSKVEIYTNSTIFNYPLNIQKIIIENRAILEDSFSYEYYGCSHCTQVSEDTIYISTDYQHLTFIGSRVYNSNIRDFIKKDLDLQLHSNISIDKITFNKYINIYHEILKLRHINYKIIENRKKSERILVNQDLSDFEIRLDKKNIRSKLMKLIIGGLSEEMW